MTTPPQDPALASPSDLNVEELLTQLRRKEGNWIAWGQSCQALQKANHTPQAIFEATGFEPIHQNQLIVAAQVFASMTTVGVAALTQAHYEQRGSDILYELRVLTQEERAQAAEYVLQRGLDVLEARELAKAMKDIAWQSKPPAGFTAQPGDALAYRYWNSARQTEDLLTRSRLIGQGLRHAQSEPARQAIEQLLTQFTVVPPRTAPRLPIFRPEAAEDLPRIIPVAGSLPLTVEDYKAVPIATEAGEFGLVQFSGVGAWVPLPGWQVVSQAEDPVGILAQTDQLPIEDIANPETVLLVVDRAQREWHPDRYFVSDRDGQLQLDWFENDPSTPLLGQLVLVLRGKKILDEGYTQELWQIDE